MVEVHSGVGALNDDVTCLRVVMWRFAEMVEVHSGVGALNDDVQQMRSEMGTIKESLIQRFNSLKYRTNGLTTPPSGGSGVSYKKSFRRAQAAELRV